MGWLTAVAMLAAIAHGAAIACKPGQASTTGVIQLVSSTCMPDFGSADINTVMALCGAAFQVDVNSKRAMYLSPLEQGQFKWAGPGPYSFPSSYDPKGSNWGVFKCSNMNATGQFSGTNSKVAAVMFYNDVGGPHSKLVVSGANQLTLQAAHTVEDRDISDIPPVCKFTYKVVSGCVMGMQPSPKPFVCPSGWYIKSGKFKKSYCAPCPLGSTSTGPNARKCTLCPPGFRGPRAGGGCTKCPGNTYSSKSGAADCSYCYVADWQRDPKAAPLYTDGKSCKRCPPDSWDSMSNPSQCAACNNGKKCCRTNPSKTCPACSKGFKSGTASKPATFVLTSTSPTACLRSDAALCSASFTVTLLPSCGIQYKTYSPVKGTPCYGPYNDIADTLGQKASMSDIKLFQHVIGPSTFVSIKGPIAKFKLQSTYKSPPLPKTCIFTYRSISPEGALLGVPPAPCSPGSPGCVSKSTPRTCTPGRYIQKNIDGQTLCLPCPAGHYKTSASSATKCIPCPAGRYSATYGSSTCAVCPAGTYSGKASIACNDCLGYQDPSAPSLQHSFYSASPGSSACKKCPANSEPDTSTPRVTRCLGRDNGKICCAAGSCRGQPACPQPVPPFRLWESAIFQLQSAQLSHASCKNATFLKCLASGALMEAKSASAGTDLSLSPINQPGCLKPAGDASYNPDIYGSFIAFNLARVTQYLGEALDSYTYFLTSDAATGTIKMFLSSSPNPDSFEPATAKCSATFKLVVGYAFDLSPPNGATCPQGTSPVNKDGRALCEVCPAGSAIVENVCQVCPAGTYQPIYGGGTKCLLCPQGTMSYTGLMSCLTCSDGSVPAEDQKSCDPCPVNTFALQGFTKCKACPAGTTSPAHSSACGFPFPK